MSLKLIKKFSHFGQKGDTIIEVLISITILASVLVTVFVVVNRDLAIELDAHEQTAALSIIQSQLEALRIDITRSGFDQQIHKSQPFCINFSDSNSNYQKAPCYFDQNQQYKASSSSVYPYIYQVQILPTHSVSSTGLTSQNGYNFKFQVRWVPPGGLQSAKNQEVLYYRLYLNPSS